ncbi:MAG: TlpA family protein disulfide reductase [Roseibium sp.]|uniref:TlpA family protein disulfide reductase n=1 Tax=Roseibium sp. TaxID=1936156 RepID=UPI001B002D8F|nr:TlpA disulfide reductase family protein [Roseibium sp.]MBO6893107.1 TlpA family protein disulfide reductase [Roseibium sp.]MBO6932065.1 TlpA family protein disulfide reductase [Roseibium sp.]
MVKFSRREILGGCAILASSQIPAFASAPDLKHLGLISPPLAIEAPELGVPDLSGTTHQLEDYRGKTVLVSFWASWCPPCRKEMPSLARLNRALGSDRFAVLAINVGDREARVRIFLDTIDHDGLPVLLDSGSELPSKWYVRGLPMSYVLNGSGSVVYGAIGEREWDSIEMIDALRAVS